MNVPSDSTQPTAQGSPWRWVRMVLGVLLMVIGIGQAYLMMRPMLELLEFIPLGFLIQEMAPSLLLIHSYAIAIIALTIGGALLIFRRRVGHVLVMGACCLFLMTMVEVMIVTSQMQDASMKALISELFADAGLFFVAAHMMYFVTLILINLRPARLEFAIQRKHRLWALGFAVFLILDFNITSAYLFL